MNRTLGIRTLLLLLVFIAVLDTMAQAPAEKKNGKTTPNVASDKKEKDPSQPSDKLKSLLMDKTDEAIPTITILAKVMAKNRPPLALLKITEREVQVTRGTVIELPKMTLKVTEINREEVRLEWQSPKAGFNSIIAR